MILYIIEVVMKLKMKLLVLSNILAIIFWLSGVFSYDALGGLSFNGGSITFQAIVIIFLIYSSHYTYTMMSMDFNKLILERPKITLMAFLSVIPNFIGTIFYIVINDNLLNAHISLSAEEQQKLMFSLSKTKEQLDPKLRKLDLMFKLGTVLVVLAGILFAFTSNAPGIARTFVSFVFGLIYVFLSKYLEKLKISSSSKLYWFMGMAFFLLAYLSIGYIALFGSWFSLNGAGAMIFVGTCFSVIALLSLATYYNFKNDFYLFGFYGGLLAMIISITRYIGFGVEETLITILPIFIVLSFFSSNTKTFNSKVLFDFTNLTVLSSILVFFISMFNMQNRIAVYVLSVLFITYIFIMIYRNKETDLKYFGSILSYCVFIPAIINKETSADTFALATGIYAAFVYAISFLYNEKTIRASALTSTNVLLVLSFIMSLLGSPIVSLVIALIAIVISLVVYALNKEVEYENKLELYSHPLKIAMLIYAVLRFIKIDNLSISEYFLVISFATNVVVYCWVKSKEMNQIYFITSVLFFVLNAFSIADFQSIFMMFLSLASAFAFYAYSAWVKKETPRAITTIYVLLLIYIYFTAFALDLALHQFGDTTYIFANATSFFLYIAIALFHRNEKNKCDIALLAATLPMFSVLDLIESVEIAKIVFSLVVIYLTLMVNRFVKKLNIRDIINYIGLFFALIAIIFDSGMITLVYLILVSVVLMLVGFYKKDSDALFKIGVISLVATLIFRFRDYILGGPVYIYILIAGLALIIFVTIRQLRYDKNLKKEEKKD